MSEGIGGWDSEHCGAGPDEGLRGERRQALPHSCVGFSCACIPLLLTSPTVLAFPDVLLVNLDDRPVNTGPSRSHSSDANGHAHVSTQRGRRHAPDPVLVLADGQCPVHKYSQLRPSWRVPGSRYNLSLSLSLSPSLLTRLKSVFFATCRLTMQPTVLPLR
jgi:hypothetical protein